MSIEVSPLNLSLMSHSEDENVRRLVAVHPLTETTTLAHLAKDKDWVVRFCISAHSNCSLEILFSLKNDPVTYTRCKVFSSSKASPELLDAGVNDVSSEVRLCIASNPNVRLETLAKLKLDKNPEVAAAARGRIDSFYSARNSVPSPLRAA